VRRAAAPPICYSLGAAEGHNELVRLLGLARSSRSRPAGCVNGRTGRSRPDAAGRARHSRPPSISRRTRRPCAGIAGIIGARSRAAPAGDGDGLRVLVTRDLRAGALVDDGRVSRVRAAELSDFALGVGKRRQRSCIRSLRQRGVGAAVAHELAHVFADRARRRRGTRRAVAGRGSRRVVAVSRARALCAWTRWCGRRLVAVNPCVPHRPVVGAALIWKRSARRALHRCALARGVASHVPAVLPAHRLRDRARRARPLWDYFRPARRRSDRPRQLAAAFGQSLEDFERERWPIWRSSRTSRHRFGARLSPAGRAASVPAAEPAILVATGDVTPTSAVVWRAAGTRERSRSCTASSGAAAPAAAVR